MEVAPILKVFVASPSDLVEERAAAQEVVRGVGHSLRSLGWCLEPHVWEEVRGGASRPQERINPLVDECDLFVGILWRRWGSSTGGFSSGFLEEFTRARDRHEKTGRPEILIYFRRLDDAEKVDQGPQLAALLQFRRELEAEGAIHFTEYADLIHWNRRFQTDLTGWVVECPREGRESQAAQSPGFSQAPDHNVTPSLPVSDEARGQVAELLQDAARVVENRPDDESRTALSRFTSGERARLSVFATSWVSGEDTGSLIGSHELNLLFLSRRSVHLTEVEARVVLQSLLADDSDILPGWYWRPDVPFTQLRPKSGLAWYLLLLSLSARNRAVRSSSLRILTALELPIPRQLDRGPFIERLLAAEGKVKGSRALRYLSVVGRASDIDHIEAAGNTIELDSADVGMACARIRARTRPGLVFEQVRDGVVSRDADLDRLLLVHANRIAARAISLALASGDSATRLLALRLGTKKVAVAVDRLVELLSDTSEDVRFEALMELQRRGARLSKDRSDDVLKPLLDRKDWSWAKKGRATRALFEVAHDDWLWPRLDWLNLNAPSAYRALGLRGHVSVSAIRADVRSRFSKLRRTLYRRWQADNPVASDIEEWQDVWHDYDELMPDRFLGAALDVLVSVGDRSDATLARRALAQSTESVVRREAVRLLAKTATRADVGLLANVAETDSGSTRELAVKTVMLLSRGRRSAAARLLQSTDPKVAVLALHSCSRRALWAKPMARSLLSSDASDVRIAALRFLAEVSSRDELLELLDSYSSRSSYYYDVVCWLDRHLFSPEMLHDYYDAVFATRAAPKASDLNDALEW